MRIRRRLGSDVPRAASRRVGALAAADGATLLHACRGCLGWRADGGGSGGAPYPSCRLPERGDRGGLSFPRHLSPLPPPSCRCRRRGRLGACPSSAVVTGSGGPLLLPGEDPGSGGCLRQRCGSAGGAPVQVRRWA
uniref:Uncharacterized protein n=1 Tax=Aegilops tauschii subsp. strangulata TaxID=200361 RepID=A0A453GCK2_AEGTS